MYRLLNEVDLADRDFKDFLQSRILRTCKGHLEWCFDVLQLTSRKTWTSENWPFGSRISDESDLMVGAINFLKLFEASETLDFGREYISQMLVKRLDGWLTHLHSSRNPKSGLWAAFEKQEVPPNREDLYNYPYSIKIPCYDLCHSVLIWQAISAVHAMIGSALSASHFRSSMFRKDMISSGEVQAVILERFSYDHTFPTLESLQTNNEKWVGHNAQDAKQRLLAFSRNGTEKPRFHWNAQSMILCEGYDWGMFAKPPSSKSTKESRLYETQERLDEWWSSLRLQTFQHAALWKKPNRYLLALILASNSGFSIDNSIDAKTMAEQCYKILLRSILIDGRIAAEIDPLTQSPPSNLSARIDSIFVVPHYLLRQQYRENLIRTILKPIDVSDLDAKKPEWTQKHIRRNHRHEKSVRSLRKRGFYAFVDKTQVFENPCEPDWLFYDPDIFTTEARSCDQDTLQAVVSKWKDTFDESSLIPEDIKDFIQRLTRFWDANKSSFQQESRKNLAIVDDIVQLDMKSDMKGVRESLCWSREMLVLLRSAREKSEIKKRLMYD